MEGMQRKKLLILLACLCLLVACSEWSRGALFQGESSRAVLTNSDVVDLSKRGLSDSAIVQRIRCSRTNFNTGTKESKRLKAKGVSEAVIREMRNLEEQSLKNCREDSSSSGSVAPQGPTRPVNSKPKELTPAQLKTQEEATSRANPSVPVSPGTTEPIPESRSPAQEPMTAPEETPPRKKTGLRRRPHNQRNRNRTPRKQGDPP